MPHHDTSLTSHQEVQTLYGKHKKHMQRWRSTVYDALVQYLNKKLSSYSSNDQNHSKWQEDYRNVFLYSVRYAGKGFRAYLVYYVTQLYGISYFQALDASMAIELVHNYSLCQDDLPVMDNSPRRRGFPSVFAAFDETKALLISDGLLTEAFSILTSSLTLSSDQKIQLIRLLSEAAGMNALLLGQYQDLFDPSMDWASVKNLYLRKTGKIFGVSMVFGAVLANQSSEIIKNWQLLGENLGILFQLKDDLLSFQNQPHIIGKPSLLKPIHHALGEIYFQEKFNEYYAVCMQLCSELHETSFNLHSPWDMDSLINFIAYREY